MALMVRKCIQATAPIIMPTKHIRCMYVWWARKNCAHPARLPVLGIFVTARLASTADGHCPADLISKSIEECGRKPGVVVYVTNYELRDRLRWGFHC